MKKTQLYLLALLIAALGLSAFAYKWKVLKFPVAPNEQTEIWEIQARVEFDPKKGPNKVTLQIPNNPPGYAVINENFLARDYGMSIEPGKGSRAVQWQIRRARGTQALYYRATIYRDQHEVIDAAEPKPVTPKTYEEPYATARASLLDSVREKSVDSASFAGELVRRLHDGNPSQEVQLLTETFNSQHDTVKLAKDLLADRQIAARIIYGLELIEQDTGNTLTPFLQVWDSDKKTWRTLNAINGVEGFPENFFLWSTAQKPVLVVEDNDDATVEFTAKTSLDDALETAKERLRAKDRNLIAYSLLDLPLDAQEVYKILLLVPLGAFIMLILRNIVGIKTFGTFMPVLIALAFNWTGVIAGFILFVVIISLGLLVRFYMERLKLLLVPRLTAVLIVVVLLMAMVSVISHKLDQPVGLNVALFPMIILTMTIERVSVAWEERGAGYAIRQAMGSLIIASLAYLVMREPHLQHLIFVFPELLLVLFAVTLVLGRYSGYRLTELFRFRNLAKDPIAEPGDKAAP